MRRWWEGLPESDYRLTALRPGGEQNVMWTPHATDFLPGNPKRPATVRYALPRLLLHRSCTAAATKAVAAASLRVSPPKARGGLPLLY